MKLFFTALEGEKKLPLTFRSIFSFLKKDRHSIQTSIEKLSEVDVALFECTKPSTAVGYLIEKSLQLNKPTIILYQKNTPPQFLFGSDEVGLIFRSYDSNTLPHALSTALLEAQFMLKKRINFSVSESILHYLRETSKKMGATKSIFLHRLISENTKKTTLI